MILSLIQNILKNILLIFGKINEMGGVLLVFLFSLDLLIETLAIE
jgi:hypothetical protein